MWLFTALMDSTVCVCVGGQYLCVCDVDGEVEWSRNRRSSCIDPLHARQEIFLIFVRQ